VTALREILTVGTPGNRLLRFGMLVLAVVPSSYAFGLLALNHPFGVDLEIPLRAAQRWVDGGVVYDPASFEVTGGAALPYLYPPFVLPFLVPLLALPQQVVLVGWVAICLLASAWALRRLRTPWVAIPILLIWPPFSEGWIGGNVQVVLFALFVSMFVARDDWAPPFRFLARDPAEPDEPALRRGLQATVIAAFKVSQLHPWLYQLRRRPTSAVLAVLVLGAVVLATVPLTGIDLWFEWLEQVRRASDPAWAIGGLGLGRYLGPAIGTAVAVTCVAAVLIVPRREAGAWVGVLSVVGSLSLRTYGILFLLPAGYRLRREIGLVAFAFIGTFTEAGMWLGIVIVAAAWFAAQRWSALFEPARAS
jgi:hypothetical protein